jgi:RNA polymerase sigma-70 factor (ECF subfamily)
MTPEFDDAYRRYFPLLVRKCARMLGDTHEAEDIAQEAFLRLHGAPVLLADPRTVTAWLYRTSTHLALDRLRARGRRPALLEALEHAASTTSPEGELSLRGLWSELLRKVPQAELEAALLRHADGLSQQEIAEVLGIHERTVRRLLSQFEARAQRLRARSEA